MKTMDISSKVVISLLVPLLCFGSEILVYQIREEPPPGVYVGNILAESALNNLTSDVTRLLEFNFLDRASPLTDYFELERNSGILKTSRSVNREWLCEMQKECVIILDVAVAPAAYFRVIKVSVFYA